MFIPGQNGGGNPNHDAQGRFTSGSNKSAGKQPETHSENKKVATGGFDDFYKESPKAFMDNKDIFEKLAEEHELDLEEKSTTGYYGENPDFWLITTKSGEDYSIEPKEDGTFEINGANQTATSDGGVFNSVEEVFDFLENPPAPKSDKEKWDEYTKSDITEYLSENREIFDENATINDVVQDVVDNLDVKPEEVFSLLQEEAQSYGMNIDGNTNYKQWWQQEEDLERKKASNLWGMNFDKK